MSGGGGYGQQWGGQSGGNMYGSPYGAMGKIGGGIGQPLTGMATTNPVSPMDRAFAPTQSKGWPMAGTPEGAPPGTGVSVDGNNPPPSGGGWDAGIEPPGVLTGADPYGAMAGGNPMPMGGAMGKMGGSVNPLTSAATTNPVGSYGDYMNRRNAWIDQLRGYVMPPQAIGGQRTPAPPATGTPAPPRGGEPAPIPRKAGPAGVDHAANFQQLMREDPSGRLASEYRLRNGDTIGWWQSQMQSGAAPGLLGGNQQMLDWMRGTSPISSNTTPLTMDEMMKLNKMAGISGPSWMR